MRKVILGAILLFSLATCSHVQRTPEFGVGAPLAEAVVDTVARVVVNEINLWLEHDITDERARVFVDSLARPLRAAARLTRAPHFRVYTLRWPNDLRLGLDSLLLLTEQLPEVERASPSLLLGVGEGGRNEQDI